MSEQSETVGKLFEALSKAQSKIEGAKKDSKNPHFGNKYADLASVWDACRKALTEQGLCVVQTFEPAGIEGTVVVTTLGHSSGEWVRSKLYVPLTKRDAQGLGSAVTYGRRYALAAIVGVSPEDDDGNEASLPKQQHGPLKAPTEPVDLSKPLAASVDVLQRAATACDKMTGATSVGELQEAWADAYGLFKLGLSKTECANLTNIKDKKRAELEGKGARTQA